MYIFMYICNGRKRINSMEGLLISNFYFKHLYWSPCTCIFATILFCLCLDFMNFILSPTSNLEGNLNSHRSFLFNNPFVLSFSSFTSFSSQNDRISFFLDTFAVKWFGALVLHCSVSRIDLSTMQYSIKLFWKSIPYYILAVLCG